MKNSFWIPLSYGAATVFTIFSACSTPQDSGNNFDNLSISFDTVHVDAREEILFLNQSLSMSDLSPDKKELVNFNFFDHTLEVIDLDELVLKEKIPFEKEGPQGTGARFSHLQYLGPDSLFIRNDSEYAYFNFKGQKIWSSSTKHQGFTGDEPLAGERFSTPHIYRPKARQVVGLARDYINKSLAFLKIDLEGKSIQKLDLPAFANFKDFHYEVQDPKLIAVPHAQSILDGSKVLLSVDYANDLYLYDFILDSLRHISNQQILTDNRKKSLQHKELANMKEFQQVNVMLREQISFSLPIWDKDRKLYYRFSYHEHDFEEEFEFLPSGKFRVYLAILDENLKLLSEHPVPSMEKRPIKPFVKDGKIWMMENIDDELAFVRISFE